MHSIQVQYSTYSSQLQKLVSTVLHLHWKVGKSASASALSGLPHLCTTTYNVLDVKEFISLNSFFYLHFNLIFITERVLTETRCFISIPNTHYTLKVWSKKRCQVSNAHGKKIWESRVVREIYESTSLADYELKYTHIEVVE